MNELFALMAKFSHIVLIIVKFTIFNVEKGIRVSISFLYLKTRHAFR